MHAMTRAQRAAVGPRGGRPLVTPNQPTTAQTATVARLRKDFGKAVKSVRAPTQDNHYLPVVMDTYAGDAVWLFNTDGKYVTRYTQRALFDERYDTDTA